MHWPLGTEGQAVGHPPIPNDLPPPAHANGAPHPSAFLLSPETGVPLPWSGGHIKAISNPLAHGAAQPMAPQGTGSAVGSPLIRPKVCQRFSLWVLHINRPETPAFRACLPYTGGHVAPKAGKGAEMHSSAAM